MRSVACHAALGIEPRDSLSRRLHIWRPHQNHECKVPLIMDRNRRKRKSAEMVVTLYRAQMNWHGRVSAPKCNSCAMAASPRRRPPQRVAASSSVVH